MNDRQRKFADEYLITNSGTKSAIAAGYSPRTAKVKASQLLVDEEIEAYIIEKRKDVAKKHGVTLDRVIEEYSKIAFFDIREIYDTDGGLISVKQLDDNSAGAIASVKSLEEWGEDDNGDRTIIGTSREVKVFDKIRALQDLGKHLGIFEKDNGQKTPPVQKTLKVTIIRPNDEDDE
jgi:phage terminase small subunit